jgi:hypothetical protein
MKEAIAIYEKVVGERIALYGEKSSNVSLGLSNLAAMHEIFGHADLAVETARRALAVATEEGTLHADASEALARGTMSQGKIAEGMAKASEVNAERARLHGADSWQVGNGHLGFAETLLRRHQTEAAKAEAELAVSMLGKAEAAAGALRNARELRALALVRLGKAKTALPEAESALAAEAKENGEESAFLLAPLLAVGEAALAANDGPRALTMLERAHATAEKAEGYPELHADVHLALARALFVTKADPARARALAERAAREYDEVRLPELGRVARGVAVGGR